MKILIVVATMMLGVTSLAENQQCYTDKTPLSEVLNASAPFWKLYKGPKSIARVSLSSTKDIVLTRKYPGDDFKSTKNFSLYAVKDAKGSDMAAGLSCEYHLRHDGSNDLGKRIPKGSQTIANARFSVSVPLHLTFSRPSGLSITCKGVWLNSENQVVYSDRTNPTFQVHDLKTLGLQIDPRFVKCQDVQGISDLNFDDEQDGSLSNAAQ